MTFHPNADFMLSRAIYVLRGCASIHSPLALSTRCGGTLAGTHMDRGPNPNYARKRGVNRPSESTWTHQFSADTHSSRASAREEAIVGNARRAFDAMLSARESHAAARGHRGEKENDDDDDGDGAFAEQASHAMAGLVGRRKNASQVLDADFRASASKKEPPHEELNDPTSLTEAVREEQLSVSLGEEELAYVAAGALERHWAGSTEEHSDADAMDAAEEVTAESSMIATTATAGGERAVYAYLTRFDGSDVVRDTEMTGATGTTTPASRRAATDKATFLAEYSPVNVCGGGFTRDIAELLAQTAWERGFASPIWGTVDGFYRSGIRVREPGGAEEMTASSWGVRITRLQRPFTLFNAEQTTLPVSVIQQKTLKDFLSHARPTNQQLQQPMRPSNLLGSYISGYIVSHLHQHPRFADLQAVCPLWISYREIIMIGAQLPEHEQSDFAACPLDDDTVANQMHFWQSHPGEARDVEEASVRIGIDLMRHAVYYNVHQLADRARFLRAEDGAEPEHVCPQMYDTRFFRAYSFRGRRMSTSLTFLMREYCKKNHFPSTGVSLWVREATIHEYNGTILETPRTRKDAEPSEHNRLPQFDFHRQCAEGSSRKSKTAASADAVDGTDDVIVPPPLTVFLADGVATLYNVLQVGNRDAIVSAAASRMRLHEQSVRDRFSSNGGHREDENSGERTGHSPSSSPPFKRSSPNAADGAATNLGCFPCLRSKADSRPDGQLAMPD